jgi:O-antigen ligase
MKIIYKILVCCIIAILATVLVKSGKFVDILYYPKQFYFLIISSVLILFTGVSFFFRANESKISLNIPDIILLFYLGYVSVRLLYTPNIDFTDPIFLSLILLVSFYFVIKLNFRVHNNVYLFKLIILAILVYALIEVIISYAQMFGFTRNDGNDFKIGGTIGNPGPLTNYFCSILPLALGFYLFNTKSGKIDYILATIGIILTLSILVLLPFTNARTSWFVSLLIVISLLFLKFKSSIFAFSFFNSKAKRLITIVSLLIIMSILGIYAYYYKYNSSAGRLVTWKITISTIKDYPMFGSGFNTFLTKHNDYQSDYFAQASVPENERLLADNTQYAFNDYLEITSELGIVGFCLFFGFIVYVLLKNNNNLTFHNLGPNRLGLILKFAIAAILFCSFTSYPLTELPIQINLFFFCAVLSVSEQKQVLQLSISKNIKQFLSFALIIISLWFISFQIVRLNANYKWKSAFVLSSNNYKTEARKMYSDIYPTMQYSGIFLYNYGAELFLMGDYVSSLKILKETEPKLNDADLYTYLGDNYIYLNDYKNAEIAFLKASNIVPHRIYPLFRLVLIYSKTDRLDKAIELAQLSVNKKLKINTPDAQEMKKKLMVFLKENGSWLN